MKIVIDDKIPYIKGILEKYAEVVYLPGKDISNKDVLDADAMVIRTRTNCNEELLKNSSVKFIATATIGFDHIDREYCAKQGIRWTNAPGCNSWSVQQYMASALCFLAQKENVELKGKTLGIIGVGNVGSKVATVGEVFDMNVLLNDPPRARREGDADFVSLEKIKAEADIITFHTPLNLSGQDKTMHLADDAFFNTLKKKPYIINTSRGEVVHNLALKRAIKTGKIAGAMLDVWENEPDIDNDLFDLLLIGTPHIAGYSRDGKANGTGMSVNALSNFFDFDLYNWYPDDIPEPDNPELIIEGLDKSTETMLCETISQTYAIQDDDNRLRENPKHFEKQRGDYPVRREFSAYNVRLFDAGLVMAEKLEKLGFQVLGDQCF